MRKSTSGFTIVELLIVIVIIGILAAIVIVAYNGIQQRAMVTLMTSDLKNAASAFEVDKVDTGAYSTTMPSNVKASSNIILQTTSVPAGQFCVNAYHATNASLLMSWSSANGLQNGLCDGAVTGSPVGGTVPTAARNVNLMPDFSHWTLTGGATYNSGTGELSLNASGSAKSPLVRVDHPTTIKTGGDMYATVASASGSLTPKAGYHVSISYFAIDGSTPALNSAGFTGNGCARGFTVSVWSIADQQCSFAGGPNVIYINYTFIGPTGGYTSTDIKMKNPLTIVIGG